MEDTCFSAQLPFLVILGRVAAFPYLVFIVQMGPTRSSPFYPEVCMWPSTGHSLLLPLVSVVGYGWWATSGGWIRNPLLAFVWNYWEVTFHKVPKLSRMESWNCREDLHGELDMGPIQRKADQLTTFSEICPIIFVIFLKSVWVVLSSVSWKWQSIV